MTVEQAFKQLTNKLISIYSISEAKNIAELAIEHITGYYKTQRLLFKNEILNDKQTKDFDRISIELLNHKPIQYLTNDAWFCNKKYYVNEHVLIPRSETEELIYLLKEDEHSFINIIDIGTGSGCIAIEVKNKFKNSTVVAIDKSLDSLEIAKKNALTFNTKINFKHLDFLEENNWADLGNFDLIISNPPYVLKSEQNTLKENVLNFEPHLALFVPDNDPFLFFRKIALFGKKHLNKHGKIVVEINELFGYETKQLFIEFGYLSYIIKDMQQKDRFIVSNFS